MAQQLEQWFIHAVDDNVTHLAQQERQKTAGAYREKSGVVGKTCPFQRLGAVEMVPIVQRDADTSYLNPPQSKRRAQLRDYGAAVLIDDLDIIRTLTSPQSEFALMLAKARNRRMDDFALQGALADVLVVDEANESFSTAALPGSQIIVNGGAGMTMSKVKDATFILNSADVDEDDRYFFYSPRAMRRLLDDTQVTSADFSTIAALANGTFPFDARWMGCYWRMSTRLNITGNIRQCVLWQKNAVGVAVGLMQDMQISENPAKWNNTQLVMKLSAGACRIDDAGVVRVDIDESV